MVWLGCAAVPVERPVLGLVLLRVPGSVQPWVLASAAMSVSARAQASAEASAEAQGTALAWA